MFRPMLAVDHEEGRLRFPYLASPKLDGIRCIVRDGVALTRTLKPIPNLYIANWIKQRAENLEGFDGELICGDPTAKDCFAQTASGVMAINKRPEFWAFFVFDTIDLTGRLPFTHRAYETEKRLLAACESNVGWVLHHKVDDLVQLRHFEDRVLAKGFEGVMLRSPDGRYKQGRATLNEGTLLKVKRFRDAEAVIVGTEERMHNANTAVRNELGRTARSSAKAGLVGMNTLGALTVVGPPGQPFAGLRFSIGTGMDDMQRASMWAHRQSLIGQVVKYRYFDLGVKDSPRFPVFVGFRPAGA